MVVEMKKYLMGVTFFEDQKMLGGCECLKEKMVRKGCSDCQTPKMLKR